MAEARWFLIEDSFVKRLGSSVVVPSHDALKAPAASGLNIRLLLQ